MERDTGQQERTGATGGNRSRCGPLFGVDGGHLVLGKLRTAAEESSKKTATWKVGALRPLAAIRPQPDLTQALSPVSCRYVVVVLEGVPAGCSSFLADPITPGPMQSLWGRQWKHWRLKAYRVCRIETAETYRHGLGTFAVHRMPG